MISNTRFLINADDFGCKSSVNKAIIDSFDQGLINSTTIMANMPSFDEAIDLSHNSDIKNNIGVHLVITEGIPLTQDILRSSHLFNGNLNLSSRLKNLFFLNKSEKDILFKEYAAQIEKVKKCNINITHLDTHHQIHDMWAIIQIMIELLKNFNIPSMRILNNLEVSKNIYKTKYRDFINSYLRKKGVNFTRYMGNQQDFILSSKKKIAFKDKELIEIMVHPDYSDDGIIKDTIGNKEYNFNFISDIQKNHF